MALLYTTAPNPVLHASEKMCSCSSPLTVWGESHGRGIAMSLSWMIDLVHSLNPSLTRSANFRSHPQSSVIASCVHCLPSSINGAIMPMGSNRLACWVTTNLGVSASVLNFSKSMETLNSSFYVSQTMPRIFFSFPSSSCSLPSASSL